MGGLTCSVKLVVREVHHGVTIFAVATNSSQECSRGFLRIPLK